ncbi:hypothetical protein MNU24_03360 [Spiroplasma poulsonii]|nr:hypothetical protein MNU24_03360 [Spiroplasma poulsonii]
MNKEQKQYNRLVSKMRIIIENIFAILKKFKIITEKYRNRRKRFGLRFNLIASIYNLQLLFNIKCYLKLNNLNNKLIFVNGKILNF